MHRYKLTRSPVACVARRNCGNSRYRPKSVISDDVKIDIDD